MKLTTSVAAAALLFGLGHSAQAEPSNFYSPGEVRSLCSGFGTYFPPTSGNSGTYGCWMDDKQGGSLIICQKKSCDTYDKVLGRGRSYLPTQAALKAAAKADPSMLSPNPNGAFSHRFNPRMTPKQERP